MTYLLAGATPPSGQQSTAPVWVNLFPIVLMFVVFYFLLIRPQTKKAKEHERLVKSLKAGSKVITSSGIVGQIITVKEKTVTIRTADSKLEILKSTVSDVLERDIDSDAPPVKDSKQP